MIIRMCVASYAGENPWITTWDANDPNEPKTQFGIGEDVRIKAFSEMPYEIKLLYPNGTEITLEPMGLVGLYERVFPGSIMTLEYGDHKLSAGSETHYGVSWYFVIPEAPLGVATALIACLAGLGCKRLRLH